MSSTERVRGPLAKVTSILDWCTEVTITEVGGGRGFSVRGGWVRAQVVGGVDCIHSSSTARTGRLRQSIQRGEWDSKGGHCIDSPGSCMSPRSRGSIGICNDNSQVIRIADKVLGKSPPLPSTSNHGTWASILKGLQLYIHFSWTPYWIKAYVRFHGNGLADTLAKWCALSFVVTPPHLHPPPPSGYYIKKQACRRRVRQCAPKKPPAKTRPPQHSH